MFNHYLAELSSLSHDVTHNNFAALQRLQADILNDYTAGKLSETEKRALYGTSIVIECDMRKKLLRNKERRT